MGKQKVVGSREFTAELDNKEGATSLLFNIWSHIPLLLMLDIDWDRGPLVLVGLNDYMMWPLLPPGSLLQLNQKLHTIDEGTWPEFKRPVYLIEYDGEFHCCYAQRKGETLLLISHAESPAPPITRIPAREAKVRGQLTPIFRPLPTRGSISGRVSQRRINS